MTIDWRKTQQNLLVASDGIAGVGTFTALLKIVADPSCPVTTLNELARACIVHLDDYDMLTPIRLANFLAQGANETGGFTRWSENLNYSAQRMTEVWPSRFPNLAAAQPYVGKPQLLANKVYGGRMGNVGPNDGWDFRGQGFLQLTGRANYEAAEKRIGLGLLQHPEMCAYPAVSFLIALHFWKAGKVNAALDTGNLREARRITNGADVGLVNVNSLHAKLMAVLA